MYESEARLQIVPVSHHVQATERKSSIYNPRKNIILHSGRAEGREAKEREGEKKRGGWSQCGKEGER